MNRRKQIKKNQSSKSNFKRRRITFNNKNNVRKNYYKVYIHNKFALTIKKKLNSFY
jgi:hypothetical protein